MGEPTDKANPEVPTTIVADGTPVQLEATGDTDQGLRAWTVVVGAWCVNLCGFGWVNGELLLSLSYPTYNYRDTHG